jgi:hypothetical protein
VNLALKSVQGLNTRLVTEENLSERLREIRAVGRLNWRDIAVWFERDGTSISAWSRGKSHPHFCNREYAIEDATSLWQAIDKGHFPMPRKVKTKDREEYVLRVRKMVTGR